MTLLARIKLAATAALRRKRCDAALSCFLRACRRALLWHRRRSVAPQPYVAPTRDEIRAAVAKGNQRLRRRFPRLRRDTPRL